MKVFKISFAILVLIIALVFVKFSFAQSITVLDTTNHEFRKNLEAFYALKSEETKLFCKKIEDRKTRKEVEADVNEFKDDFIKEIKAGYFVDEKKYADRVDATFQTIQKANPEIQNMKLLVKLGNEVNAYNFGEDIVVIYLKFIEEIGNEYHLAFTVSHEIAHQLLNHAKKRLVKQAAINNSDALKQETKAIQKQKYNKAKSASLLHKRMVYGNREESRKREIEADSLGYKLFKKAYPKQSYQAIKALELFDIIDKEKDSLSEKEYSNFFNSEKQPFKPQWIINDEIDQYKYDKTPKFWQIDSLKSHPDCSARIAILKKIYNIENQNTNGEESDFKALKKAAQYDGIVGLHYLKDYGNSLYQTLLLLKQEPENSFLRKMVYENLIKIQEAENNYTLNKYLETINPQYSNSYNTYLFFIRKLRKVELENIINLYKP